MTLTQVAGALPFRVQAVVDFSTFNPALDGPQLCTVRLARRLVKGVRSCGLDNLTQHFGFDNPARHRAAGRPGPGDRAGAR